MGRLDEIASEQFYRWEQRCRGYRVWEAPVSPEPPFEEFLGYREVQGPIVYDGKKLGVFLSILDSIQARLSGALSPLNEIPFDPEPNFVFESLPCEFVASLPNKLEIRDDVLRVFLDSLDECEEPVACEFVSRNSEMSFLFASSASDADAVSRRLEAFLPEVTFIQTRNSVVDAWGEVEGHGFIVEFGLAHEFMLPLRADHAFDPYVALISALGAIQPDEVGVFQVIFRPATCPWGGSTWRSITDQDGKMLFRNKVPLIPGAKEKLSSPLFGVVVRAASKAPTFDRAAAIVQSIGYSLHQFSRPENNHLIPLHNDDYPFDDHEIDLLQRFSRRSGMLLNREELLGFVHLPTNDVRSSRLRRASRRTKAATQSKVANSGILLGLNEHAGRLVEVGLTDDERVRHTHIIGATGTGKSTLLLNLIQQDIMNGHGLAVLDPHGDLIDRVLGLIPEHRAEDVVLLNPADENFPVCFNILSAHSDFEKNLLASDLVSVFKRLCSSWGDQMGSVLNNAILAFLESRTGGTLADLRRFLIDQAYRNEFLKTVEDPDIVFYWQKAFPQLGGNRSIGPVLTRLDVFLSPKPIRYMVSQQANKLDFSDILDSGKVFLAKLPQGQIGKENAFLLGSLLMAKLQQMAMSRERLRAVDRKDFFIYLDEFQNFITPSMEEILTGARKYRVGLVLAHQDLHQLQRDSNVASAVLSNAYTRIVFRVGDVDARSLEKGFASFDAQDLQNLSTGEAICRVERSEREFNLKVLAPDEPDEALADERREMIIAHSRRRYATPRVSVAEERGAHFAAPSQEKDLVRVSPAARAEEPRSIRRQIPETPEPAQDLSKSGQREQTSEHQHQALKEQFRRRGEELGFEVEFEKLLSSGRRIDVVLEGNNVRIACELSRTTTVDWEVGNVMKCFEEPFDHIVVVSMSTERLLHIRDRVVSQLEPQLTKCVRFFQPAEFISWLEQLRPNASAPKSNVGIKKRKFAFRPLPDDERRRLEHEKLEELSEFLKAQAEKRRGDQ